MRGISQDNPHLGIAIRHSFNKRPVRKPGIPAGETGQSDYIRRSFPSKFMNQKLLMAIIHFMNRWRRKKMFQRVYKKRLWGSDESFSGVGSEKKNTIITVQIINKLIKEFAIQSILDAPCGDYNWIKAALPQELNYTGIDIVPEMISDLNETFGSPTRTFLQRDLVLKEIIIPAVDLIICRDLLVHLTFQEGTRVLDNFKRSGSRYLLVTSFEGPNRTSIKNQELTLNYGDFGWRPLDLRSDPYNCSNVIEVYTEETPEVLALDISKKLLLIKLN